jgi:hypothetical protein
MQPQWPGALPRPLTRGRLGGDEALGSRRRAPREGDGGLELRLGRSRQGDWAGKRHSGRGVGLRARVKVA